MLHKAQVSAAGAGGGAGGGVGGWTGSCPCSFAAVGCNVVHRCWASIVGAAVTILVLLGLGTPARLLRASRRFMLSVPDQFEKALWACCAHLHWAISTCQRLTANVSGEFYCTWWSSLCSALGTLCPQA